MRILSFIMMLAFCLPAYAQTDAADTSQLTQFLLGLKDSAERLSRGNELLAGQNAGVELRMEQVQPRLQKLLDEQEKLNQASLKLKASNPARARKVAQLEKQLAGVSDKLDRIKGGMKADQSAIDHEQEQDARLVEEPAEAHGAKERLQLLKAIYESKQRQEELSRKIRAHPAQPNEEQVRLQATLENLAVEGQKLKQEMADLREKKADLDRRKTYLDSVVP